MFSQSENKESLQLLQSRKEELLKLKTESTHTLSKIDNELSIIEKQIKRIYLNSTLSVSLTDGNLISQESSNETHQSIIYDLHTLLSHFNTKMGICHAFGIFEIDSNLIQLKFPARYTVQNHKTQQWELEGQAAINYLEACSISSKQVKENTRSYGFVVVTFSPEKLKPLIKGLDFLMDLTKKQISENKQAINVAKC